MVLAWFKAAANKPLVIPLPPASCGSGHVITPVPLRQAIAGLPIDSVLFCPPEQIPADERSRSKTLFYKLQVWLYSAWSPMQAGLPNISSDPDAALAGAYTWLHRKRFGPPVLPAEYLASPDLGQLAVRGPYACYTRKCADASAETSAERSAETNAEASADGSFEWELRSCADFEHHEGLLRLGVRVVFAVDATQRSLRASLIESALGRSRPGDRGWELAKRLALCSATTHLSLVRHFCWVHLAASAQVAVATRNHLSADHPLIRLLWPYLYATQQSNDTVTRGQMLPGGDFETVYSYSFDGVCRLFDQTYRECPFGMNDPVADARARQVLGQGFDTPTEDNLAALFELMLAFARDYLALYYPHAAGEPATPGLHNDPALAAWLDALNRLVPNGVGVSTADLNFDGLARLVASIIYFASAQHEIAGGFLWNYQLWTHRQPVRVYASGQPEPIDVYQRLVNANYNLNVKRRALISDFSGLALDSQGAASMQRFCLRLEALQTAMESEPWAVWKLYPRALKVNINA